jgi:hypothetical protein
MAPTRRAADSRIANLRMGANIPTRVGRFPGRNPATIKLTHYPRALLVGLENGLRWLIPDRVPFRSRIGALGSSNDALPDWRSG